MNESTGVTLGASTAVLFVVLYVWYALALSALFAKTGESTWKAWVPVVNAATILKLGGFSPWLVLLNLVPLFGAIAFAVVFIVAVHRISVGFGRGVGTTVLGAFVQVVWASVLGFGAARWQRSSPAGRASGSSAADPAGRPREKEFAGPYVPLVGGWTPEPPSAAPPAGSPLPASEATPAPLPEPVVLPFAAPSSSLADAVPSLVSPPAPPTEAMAIPADGPRRSTPEAASVFDVLEALRSPGAPAPTTDTTRGGALDPSDEAQGFQPTLPLVPAVSQRSRTSEASASSSDESDPAPADAPTPRPAAVAEVPLVPVAWTPPRRAEPRGETPPIAEVPLTHPAPADVPAGPAPARNPPQADEEFPELSEAVSAVSGAPDAGAPRSARTSVSALYTQPEVPADGTGDDDDIEALDRTVVARRRRIPWALVAPSGQPVELTSSVVIVGRRPIADSSFPDAQLVAISDETRTVSKTHARLELRGETWFVTDLNSTNGVLFASLMGTEIEAPPGEEIEAGERFFLGDAEVRLSRRDA